MIVILNICYNKKKRAYNQKRVFAVNQPANVATTANSSQSGLFKITNWAFESNNL